MFPSKEEMAYWLGQLAEVDSWIVTLTPMRSKGARERLKAAKEKRKEIIRKMEELSGLQKGQIKS